MMLFGGDLKKMRMKINVEIVLSMLRNCMKLITPRGWKWNVPSLSMLFSSTSYATPMEIGISLTAVSVPLPSYVWAFHG